MVFFCCLKKIWKFFAHELYGFPFSIVEFRTEELMKKAVENVNKHNFNGRPLKVKEVCHLQDKHRVPQ